MARSLRTRPSEVYKISDELAAYCFDRAVQTFGDALAAELQSVEGKNKREIERKRQRILSKWIPESKASGVSQFRDPMQKG